MMSELKRALRLLPSSFYWRSTLFAMLAFVVMPLILFFTAEDVNGLTLPVLYCGFPAMFFGQQALRIEMPYLARTSRHRRALATAVPAVFQFVFQLLGWCMALLLLHIAGRRFAVPGTRVLVYGVMFLLFLLTVTVGPAVSTKLGGKGMVLFYIVFFAIVMLLIGASVSFVGPVLFDRLPLSDFAGITTLHVTLLVVVGTIATSLLYYAVLCALSRKPVSDMMMNKIK